MCNQRKRKIKLALNQSSLKKRKTKRSTFCEETAVEETNNIFLDEELLRNQLLNKFNPSSPKEDKMVLQAFRNHVIDKINGSNVQNLLKLYNEGLLLKSKI